MTVAVPWPVLPTDDQCRTIGQLRRHTGPRVAVDATPVPQAATARCGSSWTHGLGVIRINGGRLLCLRCAAALLRPPSWQAAARVRVEVLRDPTEDQRWLVPETAEAAL